MPLTGYLQFLAALIFVLALISGAAVLARRYGLGQPLRSKGQRRRLAVVESLPLDGKRRLVLIARDDVTHLLLLGPVSETVVERAIVPTPFSRALADATENKADRAEVP